VKTRIEIVGFEFVDHVYPPPRYEMWKATCTKIRWANDFLVNTNDC